MILERLQLIDEVVDRNSSGKLGNAAEVIAVKMGQQNRIGRVGIHRGPLHPGAGISHVR